MSWMVRGVLSLLGNKSGRKTLGWIVVAIFSPFIILVVLVSSFLSSLSSHNVEAVELAFSDTTISSEAPTEFIEHIEDIRRSFWWLDLDIEKLNSQMEDGDSLDSIRVKAIFYSLFFGLEQPNLIDTLQFADCFVEYEQRTRSYTDADGETQTETYTVAVPIEDFAQIYENIENAMGVEIVTEDIANASEIYYLIVYGESSSSTGCLDELMNWLPISDVPFVGLDGFVEPVTDWENCVSSEFGYRIDPFTGVASGHTGIDLAKVNGTDIYSVLDGEVIMVRYLTTSYGYYVMVDHGGGVVTLYAHCSKILVYEGEEVTAGTKIAEVGSTGKSTGNHLHFEIRIDGEAQNPRAYLP